MTKTPPGMIRGSDLCAYAGVSRATLARWRSMGLIPEPCMKTSHGRGVVSYYDAAAAREAVDYIHEKRAAGWSFPAIVDARKGDESK